MKFAGKKAGLMPRGKEVESKSEDKGENEKTEKKSKAKTKKGGGLADFMSRKMFGKKK